MAALLLGCFGIFSSKVIKKQQARKEREEEYNRDFEILKEKNAERVRQLSDAGVKGYESVVRNGNVSAERISLENNMETVREQRPTRGSGAGLVRGLPSYDDVVQGATGTTTTANEDGR